MGTSRSLAMVSVVVTGNLLAFASRRGLDPEPLLSLVGLKGEDLADPERRVPLAGHQAMLAQVVRTLDDPGVPIQAAQAVRIDSFDVMGFAVASSRDVRESLRRVCRYSMLFNDAMRWELKEQVSPGVASISRVPMGGLSLGERVLNEVSVATCLSLSRQLSGRDFNPTGVTFRHPAPRDVEAHRRFFRCPVRFSASSDGFTFAADLLELPSREANPALSAFFERHAEQLLKRMAEGESLSRQVQDAITRELASGEPSMVSVARRLGMSERSLRRHLAEEGTSFRETVEGVRRSYAQQLLGQSKASIPEIAFLVGFSDVTAFARAFKRWCGVTPARFRGGVDPSGVESEV